MRLLPLLYILTFLTGASGLIYQVVWQRFLSRMLGAETLATSLVLAIFLSGLAIGYLLFGAVSRNLKRPLLGYALLEAIVAAWGIAFPAIYLTVFNLTATWSFAPPYTMLSQGLFASVLLIGIPTVLMGATVPMLTRGLTGRIEDATRVHAYLYATNTMGAFLGTLLAGFFLIEHFGLTATVHLAAALNVIAAGGFFLIGRRFPSAADAPPPAAKPTTAGAASPFSVLQLLLIAFLSGAYVMALENVLIRIMHVTLGSSTYTFTAIVAVFIFSIATGSAIVGRLRNPRPQLLLRNQLWILVSLLAIFLTLDKWPQAAHLLRIVFQPNLLGFIGFQSLILITLLLVLFIPVALMGATVPLAFGELKRDVRQVGWHSGLLLGVNGLGCLLGSLFGGVVAFFWFDIAGAYLATALMVATGLVIAAMAFSARQRWLAAAMAALAILFCFTHPWYQSERFVLGTFRQRLPQPHSFSAPQEYYREHLRGYTVPFHTTGPSNTVGVLEVTSDRHPSGVLRSLIANGRSESVAGGSDHITISLLAHIPALLAETRGSALVIGLGTGVTVGELSLYEDFDYIAVAEISETVAAALPYFDPYLHGLRDDPRFELLLGDALRILRRTPRQWDLIISEPSNPFITGVDQLFNLEFYQLVNSKLAPGGLFMQWLQAYDTSPEILAMINMTLMSEFENLYYFIGAAGDLLILASNRPLGQDDVERARTALEQRPQVREAMAYYEVESIDDLLQRIEPAVLALITRHHDERIETEDRPKLHYLAGRAFFNGFSLLPSIRQERDSPITKALHRRYTDNWQSASPVPIFSNLNSLVEQVIEEEKTTITTDPSVE